MKDKGNGIKKKDERTKDNEQEDKWKSLNEMSIKEIRKKEWKVQHKRNIKLRFKKINKKQMWGRKVVVENKNCKKGKNQINKGRKKSIKNKREIK